MTPVDFDPDELAPELDTADRVALSQTAALLLAARPRPTPAFRGAVRRETVGYGSPAPRPAFLRRRVAALLAAGALLVLVGASGLTGSGPLAAPADRAAPVAQVR